MFPQTLADRLAQVLKGEPEQAGAAVARIDHLIAETNDWMAGQGLIHFDGHYWNILADDSGIYFSDFGLAQSDRFEMTDEDREFFARHETFDRANSAICFMYALFAGVPGPASWPEKLGTYLLTGEPSFPTEVDRILRRDAELALAVEEFFKQLHGDKAAPYPAEQIRSLLARTESHP